MARFRERRAGTNFTKVSDEAEGDIGFGQPRLNFASPDVGQGLLDHGIELVAVLDPGLVAGVPRVKL